MNTQRERYFPTQHEISGEKSLMYGWEVSEHPAIEMQRDTRNTKLHVSVTTPRQVHLHGRDQHQHGVGGPSGGSQIGRQRDKGRHYSETQPCKMER